VNELNLSLDMPRGGEFFAKHAPALRLPWTVGFMRDIGKKDPGGIKEVISRLTVLRDAWAQMLQNEASNQVVAG